MRRSHSSLGDHMEGIYEHLDTKLLSRAMSDEGALGNSTAGNSTVQNSTSSAEQSIFTKDNGTLFLLTSCLLVGILALPFFFCPSPSMLAPDFVLDLYVFTVLASVLALSLALDFFCCWCSVWNAPCVSLFVFVGTHFRIFVRKFLVHLRTVYASPQKLALPLTMTAVIYHFLAHVLAFRLALVLISIYASWFSLSSGSPHVISFWRKSHLLGFFLAGPVKNTSIAFTFRYKSRRWD